MDSVPSLISMYQVELPVEHLYQRRTSFDVRAMNQEDFMMLKSSMRAVKTNPLLSHECPANSNWRIDHLRGLVVMVKAQVPVRL